VQNFANNIFVLTPILGEANFLGGVASVKGVEGFNPEAAKKRFFEIYLDKVIDYYLCLQLC
jgi:hypothetical protein